MRSLKGAFMTQLLIRLFIRRPNSPQDPRVRAAYGNLASVVGMVCNILLCLGKFVVGTLFGSIAITADALNNLSDASSNIVSLVGFKLAAKAPDAEHPYGHARFEYLAGLVVSVTILGIGFSLLKESVTKVLHPTPVQFGWLTVAVLVVSILVKLWMSGFNRAIGRIISSETLIATAAEWIAGHVLERIGHGKWWDYSKLPFNIGGYVCLLFSLIWGVACVFIVYFVHPLIHQVLSLIPHTAGIALIAILGIALLSDMIVTTSAIVKFNQYLELLKHITDELHAISNQIGAELYQNVMHVLDMQESSRQKLDDVKLEVSEEIRMQIVELKTRAQNLGEKVPKPARRL